MSGAVPEAPTIETRLRLEINHLRRLIQRLQKSGCKAKGDRGYLRSLHRALVRKLAALDYISNGATRRVEITN